MTAELHPLGPAGEPLTPEAYVAGLDLRPPPDAGRPFVTAAMIASIDGRAAVAGRSVALGHPADRGLFRSLRAAADAVLVGTGTLRAERYANILDRGPRERREAQGRPGLPLLVTISRSFDVPWDIPLFAEPDARVLVLTEAQAEPPELAAQVRVARFGARTLDPQTALEHLYREEGVRSLLCEGGPLLLHAVVAADCLDALMLTISPLLAAGDAPSVLSGRALLPPPRLGLADVLRADDHLFLRYMR